MVDVSEQSKFQTRKQSRDLKKPPDVKAKIIQYKPLPKSTLKHSFLEAKKPPLIT